MAFLLVALLLGRDGGRTWLDTGTLDSAMRRRLQGGGNSTDTMQAADAAVLRVLYETTGGADWSNNSGWGDPVSCVAHGVTCGPAGEVVRLRIVDGSLTGGLPTEVGGLEAPPGARHRLARLGAGKHSKACGEGSL